jgi:Mce-associated membrane protein
MTVVLKAIPPESSGEPDPNEDGADESLGTSRGQSRTEGTLSSLADVDDTPDTAVRPPRRLAPIVAYGILPAAALLLAIAAGYLKWVDGTARDAEVASTQSVQAAIDSTMAMLSYRPETVEQNLSAARDRITGPFRDSYTSLTHDVVIPGAKQRQISAVASVPAAASVSASATHAVVLVFVNQTTVVGNGAPTDTASSVKVTLDKVNDRWLISQFDPV